jgi:hypothetical protein
MDQPYIDSIETARANTIVSDVMFHRLAHQLLFTVSGLQFFKNVAGI